ncbi:MAG: CvpA family protein [Firmicutes bacterium]|nr:CvpA family protein [Bacillota bacterium]
MNWLDMVVFTTVGIRTWFGYRRGLIHQVFHLLGLVVGLPLAVGYYSPLQRVLVRYLKLPPPVLAVLSSLLLLLGVMLLARILGRICTNLFRLPGLGLLNALSGALLGALVSLMVIAILLAVLQLFSITPVETALSTSLIAPHLKKYTPLLFDFVNDYLPLGKMEGFFPPGEPLPMEKKEL